jgi:hypothetical protein
MQQKELKFVNILIFLRNDCAKALPLNDSFLRYDLILKVIEHELNNEDLTFKKLYSSLNHSDLGIRNHLIKLQDTKWISIQKSEKDGRSKIIKCTDKLRKNYLLLIDNIAVKISQNLQTIS